MENTFRLRERMNLIEEQWHLESQGEEVHSLFAFGKWLLADLFRQQKSPSCEGQLKERTFISIGVGTSEVLRLSKLFHIVKTLFLVVCFLQYLH